jgi:hypothetical protein
MDESGTAFVIFRCHTWLERTGDAAFNQIIKNEGVTAELHIFL